MHIIERPSRKEKQDKAEHIFEEIMAEDLEISIEKSSQTAQRTLSKIKINTIHLVTSLSDC